VYIYVRGAKREKGHSAVGAAAGGRDWLAAVHTHEEAEPTSPACTSTNNNARHMPGRSASF
jgi:hypothetical protein